MSLRNRLVVGVLLVLGTLVVAGAVVGAIYRSSLTEQLDDRLRAYAERAPGLVGRLAVADGAGRSADAGSLGRLGGPPGGLSDVFVGVVADDGSVQALITPTNDDDLSPQIITGARPGGTYTVPNRGTSAGMVRVMVRAIDRPGSTATVVLIGISTREIDSSFARLRRAALLAGVLIVAVLGIVSAWMIRLGVRPIAQMTGVADAISSGEREVRAPTFPAGTEAQRLSRALNAMIDETQRTEGRLRRFVADASHELRTPLTTLRGYSALFAAGGLRDDEAVRDAMRRIGSEGDRMGTMVDDLLLLADLDEQRPLERGPVDLRPVIADLVADAQVVQADREITAALPAGALVVTGDSGRLTQAVSALIANALRHTPRTADVEVAGSTTADGRVRIAVTDHGPGIPAEDLPRLVERFYRVDPSRTRTGGSGLGLSIVEAIVTAHSGTLRVESKIGRGSTFTIELPT